MISNTNDLPPPSAEDGPTLKARRTTKANPAALNVCRQTVSHTRPASAALGAKKRSNAPPQPARAKVKAKPKPNAALTSIAAFERIRDARANPL